MKKKDGYLWKSAETMRSLMEVARGRQAPDLALVNAKLLNVYTGEILDGQVIYAWDRWIAFVGNDPPGSPGPETRVIDAQGRTVIPGLIDGHTHNAWLCTPHAFLEYAMAGGTTTIITETLEPYPVAGLDGVLDFLDAMRDQPIKMFATAPIMVSTSDAAKGIPEEELRTLLHRDDVLGLGESYWQAVLQEPERFLPSMELAARCRKTLEGHTAGAGGANLQAYAGLGIGSCHEPVRAEEVLQRLRLGLRVMAREGGIRRDLEEIARIQDMGVDLRRLILASDSVTPGDLITKGYMESILRKAIGHGFDPVTAIRMVTLNVAEHFGIDHLVGGVAPGRFADMVLIPDIRTIQPDMVISNGSVIAREGRLLVPPRAHAFHEKNLNTIRLRAEMRPEDFAIRGAPGRSKAKLRVIDMVTDLVTKETVMEMDVVDGAIHADPRRDILKVAAVDRTISPGKVFTGLIRGFRMRAGALASSSGWDTTDILVVGADDGDMALAVNRIAALRGGAVICKGGRVLEELAMPIFGIMSPLPLKEIHERLTAIGSEAAALGIPFADPLLSLTTLSGAAIPFLRICEEGLVDLKTGTTMGLWV